MQENFRFCCYLYKSSKLSFPFFLLRYNKRLNASMLTTDVFELVQQFYHGTEIGRPNAANAVSACPDEP